jgi:Zn-dependent protease with chaperone function
VTTTLPESVPPGLPHPTSAPPKPSRHYTSRVWLAVGGLLVFMLLYLALAGWFLFTAYQLTLGSTPSNGDDAFVAYLAAACALFLAVLMLKGLFFVKRGSMEGMYEITADKQPALFKFLFHMADAAGAPRPHRVFLSSRVNASVSYDLSILNLLLPSRKNLEIGLGLVNVLTLGELRAVLAHEFGHFAQRSMAVGRWVYIAQQIAGHLVARRDRFDRFLQGLSRSDVRIAWLGWLISLIVWAIRSLVDSAFRVVVLMQRALSREMEYNADLVAVHLTGSDSLVHALHRLQAADDSWDRALRFAAGQQQEKHTPQDIFAIQTRILALMRQILNDATYGEVAPVPQQQPEQHRVFKAGLAQPPRMWLTHPLNHEREANAKRRYIASTLDDSSAWSVFKDADQLRAQLTVMALNTGGSAPEPLETTLQRLNEEFTREHLQSRYRGIYLGRSAVRHVRLARELYDTNVVADRATHGLLYPASLTQDMELLRTLELDLRQLRGLDEGALKVEGRKIRHRGGESSLSELPALLAATRRELDAVQGRLQAHDRLCRSWHAAAARQVGQDWPAYLESLLHALHYADHAEADLRDAQGWFHNRVAIETATRRISPAGRKRVLQAAAALYETLKQPYAQREQVQLGSDLGQLLGVGNWQEEMGRLGLEAPTAKNLGKWLDIADSWVNKAANMLGALRGRALETLLLSESRLSAHLIQDAPLGAAGAPTRVPESYATLLPGQERERQTRLSWWGRFQLADGMFASAARLVVAGGIVAVVLGIGLALGSASVQIYNGLGQAVVVKIGDKVQVQVPPFSTVKKDMDPNQDYTIETRTADGRLIETFQGDLHGQYAHAVYNVAGASPLVIFTSVYGNMMPRAPRSLGAPRWTTANADIFFGEAPDTISTNGGGGTRTVLKGGGDQPPNVQMRYLSDDKQRAAVIMGHAAWDSTSSPYTLDWLSRASSLPGFPAMLAQRLQASPKDRLLLRLQLETAAADGKQALCDSYRQRAPAAPDDADVQYFAIRCMPDGAAKDQAYVDAQGRFPNDPWLTNAAGNIQAEHGQWARAQPLLQQAYGSLPAMADAIAVDLVRIMRVRGQADAPTLYSLSKKSPRVKMLLAMETGQGVDADDDMQAYPALAKGRLDDALKAAHADPAAEARVLRLAAASDGASADMVQRALALPASEGLDEGTLWTSVALAAREKRDYSELLAHVPKWENAWVPTMRAFLESVLQGRPQSVSDGVLSSLPPDLRGQAYNMAVVVLGKSAPQAWRNGARTLLFSMERPYFAAG